MKKITLLLAAFIFAVGAFAQDCSSEVADNPENGWGNLHLLMIGSDFVLPANQSMDVTSVEFTVITNPGATISAAYFTFYEDSEDGPGAQIGDQIAVSDIAVSVQAPVFQGFDYSTVTASFDAVNLPGDASSESTYWVGIIIDYDGANSYLGVTDTFNTNNASYLFDADSQTWIDGADPFNGFGDFFHGIVSVFGDCAPLGIEDFQMGTFTHFIQNNQLFLESGSQIGQVSIFNLLGQEVVASNLNATAGNIDLGSLTAGVYIAKANVNGQTKTFKFSMN